MPRSRAMPAKGPVWAATGGESIWPKSVVVIWLLCASLLLLDHNMATSATELLNREIPSTLDWMDRVRLWSGVAVCFALFWYGAAAIGLPAVPHMGGSLLGQPQPSLAIGAVAAGLIICTVIGRVIV